MLLPADVDIDEGVRQVSAILGELDGFLATVPGLDAEGRADLRLVCDELCSNVVRHASRDGTTRLGIKVEAGVSSVKLTLRDDCAEFNPLVGGKPYVGSDLEQRRIGGLGLYLIRQLFPLASYQRSDGVNIIRFEYHMGADGVRKMQRSDTVNRLRNG